MHTYRNEMTGQLVRVHRTSTSFLAPTTFEQENVITGERTPLASLEPLKLVSED